MPALREYALFICHAWDYSDDYYQLVNFLNRAPNFRWTNLSVPQHEPLDEEDTERLEYEPRNQIRPAHAVLIPAGMYSANRERWVDWELSFARRCGRPVIGIIPWGAQRVPVAVQRAAIEIVGWNTATIVAAIRQHALGS